MEVMPQNDLDRRVQKTRKLLQDALIELVAEKGYEAVSIREILDRANVGRSTFYAHFQDKDQLLHSILERLDELFEQHKKHILDAAKTPNSPNETFFHSLSPTLSLFQFAGQNHLFFKSMLGNRGYGIFAKPVYDYVFAHIHGIFNQPIHSEAFVHLHEPLKKLSSSENYGPFESEVAAHYFASALMGILVWWVEKDMPCSAEEIDKLFRQLAMPGFRHVLAANPEA
jgi:AcrR family transcriptional regulator